MIYPQIFKEIYHDNKKFILSYITICLIFSVLAFGNGSTAAATATYTTSEVVSTLGGNFGVIIAPIAQTYLGSIDTPTAMFVLSAVSFALDVLPQDVLMNIGDVLGVDGLENLTNYSFGIMDVNFFRIFFLIWFVLSKLSRSNHVTYTIGTILEDIEVKFGAVLNFLVVATQILANIPLDNTALAASATPQQGNMIGYGFNALLCFLLLMVCMIIFLLIRSFFFFIDIVLLPVCSIVPFSSTVVETAKTLGIIGLIHMAVFHPVLFFVIFILTLIISIVLFKRVYLSTRYFKNIYTRPFFKKFTGYNKEIPLIAPKIPKKVTRFVNGNADMIIPVYLLKKIPEFKFTSRHERWWFVVCGNTNYICRPCFTKNSCYCIEFDQRTLQKMYIKKSLRFFEIFDIKGNNENIGKRFHKVPKNVHFVFSKEYLYRFDEIKSRTGLTDFSECSEKTRILKPKKALL